MKIDYKLPMRQRTICLNCTHGLPVNCDLKKCELDGNQYISHIYGCDQFVKRSGKIVDE